MHPNVDGKIFYKRLMALVLADVQRHPHRFRGLQMVAQMLPQANQRVKIHVLRSTVQGTDFDADPSSKVSA
jgi:hypothetical protein